MSMRYVAPVVAEANPNLYSAALRAGLTPGENNQIEQMSWAIKKNRELNRMSPEAARREYESLDPDIQETLKYFYSNAEYMQAPPDFSDRALGALKFIAKTPVQPLIQLFKVAGAYNRVINTPYLVGRQITQGESIFDVKVWSDAWNGKDIYDNGALAEAIDFFGKEKVFVARQLLQGRRPGEILEAYGDLTPAIVNAMTEAFNDPDSFKQVMDATKYAQVSPGRDFARILDTKPPKNGGPAGDYIDGFTKNLSGTIDFAYQIMIDPLTWITGGTSKAITRGSQLAEMATKMMNAGESSGAAVARVFQDAGVRKLWDKQIGKDIRRLAEATTDAEKASIRKYIGRRYTGYNNDEAIDFFVRNKMFDANSAEKIFADAENTMLLLSGRLDGITFKRNGVATARNQRRLAYGLNRILDDVFNAVPGRRTFEQINAKGDEAFAILSKAGEEADKAVNPMLRELIDLDKDVSFFRRQLLKLGRAAARNPGGQFILIGDDAIKTADTFRQVARQVLSRDLAEVTTQKFLRASEDEQVVIIRNLYGAIMMRAGLEGSPLGTKFMEDVLSKTLNERAGFTTTKRTPISEDIAKLLSPYSVRVADGQAELLRSGAIQPSQLANAIAPLPYEEIAMVAWQAKGKSSKLDMTYAIGGAQQSQLARNFTDFWSVFTLFPRLGIRSAIDEAFFFYLTATNKELYNFVRGQGRKLGRATTAYTGSRAAAPLITDKFRKLTGRKVPINEIPLAERNLIVQNKVDELNELNRLADEFAITPAEISYLAINKEIADRASIFLKGITPFTRISADDQDYWLQLMVHNPDALGAMASSVAAKTIAGQLDEPFTVDQINLSELTRALNVVSERLRDAGKLGKKDTLKFGEYRPIEIDDLAKADPAYLTIAHYDNWFIRFAVPRQHGALKLEDGYRVAPASVFFDNNALRTPEDLTRAVNEILQSVGVQATAGGYKVAEDAERALKKFLSYFGDTVMYRQQGLPDEAIARIYAEGMLIDLRNTFHGSANFARFNEGLYDAVLRQFNSLKVRGEVRGKLEGAGVKATYTGDRRDLWEKAAASIDIDKFDDLTKDFKLQGFINTRIDFQEFTDFPNIYRRYGNKAMELMDRQLTSILRQPLVQMAYIKYRNAYSGLEREWVEQYVKKEMANNPQAYRSKGAQDALRRRAELIGQKRFSEIGLNEAVDQVLKYADNPSIRSNFALSVRTVGRFYRATEDFHRRVFRLKDVPLRALYRMRLAHLGLNASGDVYEDADGKPYIMMPMDNVIFKATDTTLRVLTGQTDSQYKQPMFNDFTVKLELANPSFAPQAGVPQFSGPIAALSVIAIRNLLGNFDNPAAQKVADQIDNYALGDIGDNVTIRKAVVPATLEKVWTMLDPSEKSRQEVTAAQQAIAYNAANGIYLNPSASNQEKAAYLKNVRVSAHNILFMRSLLGLISPVAPTMQESQGVPDYLLDVGITGLRPEFFDILESIQAKYGDDVQDPYEMALSIFTGKYPGKIVYTVSRNENQTKVLIKSTEEMKDWALSNRKFIKTYGEAAYIFAPRTGEFNAAAYNWLQANDLIADKTLEKYFDDVQVAQDKQAYYDIARWEQENMGTEGRISERGFIVRSAQNAREGLINSNPLLLAAITGGGNEIATEKTMMETIREITNDANAPVDESTRMRMRTALQAVDDFLAFSNSPDVQSLYNGSDLKREYRNRVQNILSEVGSGNPYVREASRASFNSILSYYSRDSYKVVP